MISSKMFYVLFFLHSVNICAMVVDVKPKREKWMRSVHNAIKAGSVADLTEVLAHIKDPRIKKHIFRKIAREKPEDTLLLETVLASGGLEFESPDDKETLLQFVERKNLPALVVLVKKYITLNELERQIPSLEDTSSIVVQATDDIPKASGKKLVLSKSGKIRRHSSRRRNPLA